MMQVASRYDELIVELDRIVIDRAARRAAYGQPVKVGLAEETVADPGLLEHTVRAVRRYHASPWLITFQVAATRQGRRLADRLGACGFRTILSEQE